MSDDTTPTPPALDALAAALANFQAEMPTVPKTQTANTGTYSYKYAGLADVTEAAMPLLAKHGLSFVTLPGTGVLVGKLLHKSGQSLTASLPITGSNPQQIGSSLTYMRRYLLGCMTGLVTDEDEDGTLASQKPKRQAAKAAPARPAAAAPGAMTPKSRAEMFALFSERGAPDAEQLPYINATLETAYTSRSELTEADARAVIAALRKMGG